MKKQAQSLLCLLLAGSMLFYACKKDKAGAPAETNAATDGNMILSCYSSGTGAMLEMRDTTGAVILTKSSALPVWNFQRWKYNGKVRYSYVENKPEGTIPGLGHFPGTHVILDENLAEINRFNIVSHNDKIYDAPNAYDGHEFILLEDDHYIAIAYQKKMVSNIPATLNPTVDCMVITAIIQEVKNNKVIFEWDATDFPEFYSGSVESNDFSDSTTLHDYVHINSIFVDPADQNLIVSFRHLNQVLKLNRTTGAIIWRLGGANSNFPLTSDMKFLRQHHATLINNGSTLLLVDNGEKTERAYSRILEFNLDESARTIKQFKQFTVLSYFIQYTGSVQKSGDNYLIGCGTAGRFIYVNSISNKYLLNVQIPNSYRSLRY